MQSFHPPTHRAVTRKTDLARVETRVRQLRRNGNLHLHLDLIAGLPREDFRQFARSFDRAFALRPHQLQLGFLKLLPGTRLRRRPGPTAMSTTRRRPMRSAPARGCPPES